MKAGLITSHLVDVLVVPLATSDPEVKNGKPVKKARVLISEEVQKELEEREQNCKDQEEAKAKRKKERELKKIEKEIAAAKRKDELKIKKEIKEKAKAGKKLTEN